MASTVHTQLLDEEEEKEEKDDIVEKEENEENEEKEKEKEKEKEERKEEKVDNHKTQNKKEELAVNNVQDKVDDKKAHCMKMDKKAEFTQKPTVTDPTDAKNSRSCMSRVTRSATRRGSTVANGECGARSSMRLRSRTREECERKGVT